MDVGVDGCSFGPSSLRCWKSESQERRSMLRATLLANCVTEVTVPAPTWDTSEADPLTIPARNPRGPRQMPWYGRRTKSFRPNVTVRASAVGDPELSTTTTTTTQLVTTTNKIPDGWMDGWMDFTE